MDAKIAPMDHENDSPAKKKKKAGKNGFLLNLVTEKYVDDSDLYRSRITRRDRIVYFMEVLKNRGKKAIPNGFKNYISTVTAADSERSNYPSRYLYSFTILKSIRWDFLYLNLFILWIILIVGTYDNWIATYVPSLTALFYPGAVVLLVPLLLMFVCQIIPSIAAVYFIYMCNDMVHYLAQKDFGSWSYSVCLIMQYIENFYFGGRGRSRFAGKVRLDPNRTGLFTFISKSIGLSKEYVEVEETLQERMKRFAFDVELGDTNNSNSSNDSSNANKSVKINTSTKATSNTNTGNTTNGETQVDDGAAPTELGILGKLKLQKELEEKEMKRIELEQIAAEEALVTEWTLWKCVCCNTDNRRPTVPKPIVDLVFGTAGDFYKRTYCKITPRVNLPVCVKCGTVSNYKPPLSSAHTFKNYPKPYEAFLAYPKATEIQPGLSNSKVAVYYNSIYSFFFGLRNNSSSLLAFNDWRLRLFVNSQFMEIPRYVKPVDELFVVGEFIESKLQRSEWCRARITVARPNHTYDIKYDPGDELRLVNEKFLRLPPDKRNYAYRVELMFVLLVVLFPLFLVSAMVLAPGTFFLLPLGISVVLLCMRISSVVKYCRAYSRAGICPIVQVNMIHTLPVVLLLVSSVEGLLKDSLGTTWSDVAILWIITKFSTIPALYMHRPQFVVFSLPVFLLSSACFYLLGAFLDGVPIGASYIGIPFAPALMLMFLLRYIRIHLHNIWDVNIKIRPPAGLVVDTSTIWERIYDYFYAA